MTFGIINTLFDFLVFFLILLERRTVCSVDKAVKLLLEPFDVFFNCLGTFLE